MHRLSMNLLGIILIAIVFSIVLVGEASACWFPGKRIVQAARGHRVGHGVVVGVRVILPPYRR